MMKTSIVMLSLASFALLAGCGVHSAESIQWSGHVIRNNYIATKDVSAQDIAAVIKAPDFMKSHYRLTVWVWEKEDHELVLIGPSSDDVRGLIRLEPAPNGGTRILTYAATDLYERQIVQRAVKEFSQRGQIEGPKLYEDGR